MLCCLGCAIFGITEVPTDGVEFDTEGLSDSGTQESPMAAAAPPDGVSYVPPTKVQPCEPQPSTRDLEKGETAPNSATSTIQEPVRPEPMQPLPDLLDDVEQGKPENDDSLNVSHQSAIHELD